MFYKVKIQDHIRIPPNMFEVKLEDAIVKRIRKKYEGYISEDLGISIDVSNVQGIGEGTLIPGDGAPYYYCTFELLTFKPEMHEIVPGKVKDIADFGVFLNIGPIEGMIHIETMDDFVSFSKDKTLAGKESKKKILKVDDLCKARIIAVSFKDVSNPKIGLTMRQPTLGRLDWIDEPKEVKVEKAEKADKKEKKK